MKQLICFLNRDTPLGPALNSLAHTILGMGHRIPGEKAPSYQVFFLPTAEMRTVRQACHHLHEAFPRTTVYSDYMTLLLGGEKTDRIIANVKATPEADLVYTAVSICGDAKVLDRIKSVAHSALILKGYKPFTEGDNDFDFLPPPALWANDDPRYAELPVQKASLILDKSVPLPLLINGLITSCLHVGRCVDFPFLHLLRYVDSDGQVHPGISYHSFPILSAGSTGKLQTLGDAVSEARGRDLGRAVLRDPGRENKVYVVCIMGEKEAVEAYTRKSASLWTRNLDADALEPSKEAASELALEAEAFALASEAVDAPRYSFVMSADGSGERMLVPEAGDMSPVGK